MNPRSRTIARLFIGFCATLLSFGCSVNIENGGVITNALVGSGVSKAETRELADFTEVDVGNSVTLDLTVGEATSLEITTDDNLLPHVITNVENGRLKISVDTSYSTKIGVKVKASTPDLKAMQAGGATTSTVTGVKGEDFRLDLSGASKNTLSGTADQFHLTVGGASTCHFQGTGKQMELHVSGASKCDASGETERLVVECSGSSTVKAAELVAQTVDATTQGASKASVHVLQELKANASGASTIHYSGSPAKANKAPSGASSIQAQ